MDSVPSCWEQRSMASTSALSFMPTGSGPVASVRSLGKRYPGGVVALDGVELELSAGSITALIGPNGSGKTTLLRILAGRLAPTSGTANVLGVDPAANPTWLRRRVGFISQEVALDPEMTGGERLRLLTGPDKRAGGNHSPKGDQQARTRERARRLPNT